MDNQIRFHGVDYIDRSGVLRGACAHDARRIRVARQYSYARCRTRIVDSGLFRGGKGRYRIQRISIFLDTAAVLPRFRGHRLRA